MFEKINKKVCRRNSSNEDSSNYNDGGINKLNDDCLREIFQNLSKIDLVKIERVCKRWQMVSKSSWNDFTEFDFTETDYFNGLRYKKKAFFGVISRGGFFLKNICLNFFDVREWSCITTAEVLQIFGDYCVNIENLRLYDFGKQYFSDKELKDMDNRWKNLFLNNKKLNSLTMHRINMTGDCLLSLPFETIESIDLDFLNINNKYLKGAFSKLKNLKYCTLNHALGSFHDLEIVLNEISFDKNKLVYLCLKQRLFYSKKKLSTYFAAMKNLKTIVLHNSGVSKSDLLSLPSSIENFEYSEYGVAYEKQLLCVSHFINLKEIKIDGLGLFYEFINDDLCEQLRKCKELRCVKLFGCDKLTDLGILKISSLPELTTLHLSESYKITNAILPALIHLKNLYIAGIKKISCDDVLNYIENANNLEVIDIHLTNWNWELNRATFHNFKEAFMKNENISEIKIIFNFSSYSFKK